MTYGYPDWSEKDAKSGVYGNGSFVVYKCLDGIERVFKFASTEVDSTNSPENNVQWQYVDDIIYEWTPRIYKIGEVVRYNNLRYIATKRYQDGTSPPNEEVDEDGVRTWMLNYDIGTTPVTPFFTKKKFGYLSINEVYPYGNYLDDISMDVIPWPPSTEPSNLYNEAEDRFANARDAGLVYFDRRPEEALIKSSMEANPYSDLYVKDLDIASGEQRWTHRSRIRSRLFSWINKHAQDIGRTFFVPKTSIPFYSGENYWNSFYDISFLTDGVSLEYYPDENSENLELIMQEYSVINRDIVDQFYLNLIAVRPIGIITPLHVSSSNNVTAQQSPATGIKSYDFYNGKMQISINPINLLCDSALLKLHFFKIHTPCWVSGTDNLGFSIIECDKPIYHFFKLEYLYDSDSRNSTRNYTSLFLGKPMKIIENPNYDPNCVEPPPPAGPYNGPQCPPRYIAVPDPSGGPDTSLNFSDLLDMGDGETSIKFTGWEIV